MVSLAWYNMRQPTLTVYSLYVNSLFQWLILTIDHNFHGTSKLHFSCASSFLFLAFKSIYTCLNLQQLFVKNPRGTIEDSQSCIRSCLNTGFSSGVHEVVLFLRPVPYHEIWTDSLATVNQGCKPGPIIWLYFPRIISIKNPSAEFTSPIHHWVVVLNVLYFQPCLGKMNLFNHQLDLEPRWFFSSFWVYSQVNPKFWLL